MKQTTFAKRLQSLTTKKGHVNSKYDKSLDLLIKYAGEKKDIIIHYNSWSRNNGHYRLVSCYFNYYNVLCALKLKFREGNDAPRGGADGAFICIPKSEIAKIKGCKNF